MQFTVDADQPGCPTASAPVTFVQASMVPERLFGRLLALLVAAAALGGLWFGVVKPAIRDAADDAVAEQLPLAVSATTTIVDNTPVVPNDSVPVTTTVVAAPPVDEGVLFSQLLAPATPAGQTTALPIEVPAGSTLQLTDIALQNPDKDSGLAVLLNGASPIYTFSLADVSQGDKRVSLVSPIAVAGGSSLIFQVTCSGPGDPTGTGNCTTSMLVSGRMVTDT